MAARHSLADVQAAAREGNIEFDEASALHKTSPLFETLLEVHHFAKDVLLALRDEDWRKTVELEPPHAGAYDVYEKTLDAAVCARHGVGPEWYLKLKLVEGLYGHGVFFVSFHQPEHSFNKSNPKPTRGGRP